MDTKSMGLGRCYIIAEIGPNFCVSADRAENMAELIKLARVAADAGCQAIKLQLKGFGPGSYYAHEDLTRPIDDPRSPFRTRGEYVRARELTDAELRHFAAECERLGLEWSASPWDVESVGRLRALGVGWVKVASASLTDLPLLAEVAMLGVPVVLSTGMSTASEIDAALRTLSGCDLALLHCVSAYPAPESECNLRAMMPMRSLGYPVGWSDHTRGTIIPSAAVALGAAIVEKHITMDRTAWGPDHAASLEPRGLRTMVRDIRLIESAMGDGVKRPMLCEGQARARLRRVG